MLVHIFYEYIKVFKKSNFAVENIISTNYQGFYYCNKWGVFQRYYVIMTNYFIY